MYQFCLELKKKSVQTPPTLPRRSVASRRCPEILGKKIKLKGGGGIMSGWSQLYTPLF